ncbi:MAG: carboxypeptidase-like regulatory domain-containing protein, partial [Candidatus Didemnitutus sp.]|nr:carboxypeptidase-like regulatory domain-containing protein [Candidatus Didemnitutus sp.]
MATFVVAVALISGVTTSNAQSNTAGAIYGKVASASTVTAVSNDTSFTRSATASADGNYRIGALPPGTYKVSYTDASGAIQSQEIDVSIASNTQVGIGSDVYQMERFVVG